MKVVYIKHILYRFLTFRSEVLMLVPTSRSPGHDALSVAVDLSCCVIWKRHGGKTPAPPPS